MEKIRTQIEHAIDAARIGRVFPKKWPTRNTGRHAKEPLEKGYQANATRDPQAIRETWTKHPKANIGILVEGFFVLDVEHDGIEPLNAFLTQTGSTLPATITVISGREGLHYYFRCHGLEIASRSQLPGIPRVEILGHGANVTAAGSRLVAHPLVPEQGLYRYAAGCSPDEIEMAEAPQWLLDLATRKDLRSIKPVQNKLNGPVDLQELAEALQFISPDIERNLWRNNVWAIHHATNGSEEGYKAAKNWSQRGQKWDRKAFDRIWHDAAKDRGRTVGIGTVYRLAQENGWNRPWFDDPLLSVEDARAQLQASIDNAFTQESGVTVIDATPGLGKTHGTIRAIGKKVQQNPEFLAHFFVPEHVLGFEIANTFRRLAPHVKVAIIEGRNPNNCKRHDLVNELHKHKLSVTQYLCGEGQTIQCPHAKTCPYLAQRNDAADANVLVMSHAKLSTPPTVEGDGRPDLIVIDENPLQEFIRISKPIRLDQIPTELQPIIQAGDMEALRDFDFGTHLETMDAEHRKPAIYPSAEDDVIRRALANASERNPAYILLLALKSDVEAGMPTIRSASRFEKPTDEGTLVAWRTHSHKVPKRLDGVPVLVLDGTAQELVYRELLGPSCRIVKIRAKTQQTVIQIRDKSFSRSQLKKNPSQDLAREIISQLPDPIVFASKQDAPLLEALGVDYATEGRLRGRNEWAGRGLSVQLGRMEPKEYDISLAAKAIFFRAATPVIEGFTTQKRIYRMKNGVRSSVSVRVAKDPRVQAYLETIREAGLTQNMHRTRPLNQPTTHILLTNVPVEAEVDFVLKVSDLQSLVKIPRLFERHGTVPTSRRQLIDHIGLGWRDCSRLALYFKHYKENWGGGAPFLKIFRGTCTTHKNSDMAGFKAVTFQTEQFTTPLEALTVRDSLDEVRADLVKLYKCPIHVAWADDATNAVPFEVPAIVEQAQPLAAVVGADSRYIPPDAKNHRIATFADEEAAYEAMERAALMESSTLNRDQADILAIHEAKGSQVLDDGWRPVNLQFPPDFDWSSVKPSTSKITVGWLPPDPTATNGRKKCEL